MDDLLIGGWLVLDARCALCAPLIPWVSGSWPPWRWLPPRCAVHRRTAAGAPAGDVGRRTLDTRQHSLHWQAQQQSCMVRTELGASNRPTLQVAASRSRFMMRRCEAMMRAWSPRERGLGEVAAGRGQLTYSYPPTPHSLSHTQDGPKMLPCFPIFSLLSTHAHRHSLRVSFAAQIRFVGCRLSLDVHRPRGVPEGCRHATGHPETAPARGRGAPRGKSVREHPVVPRTGAGTRGGGGQANGDVEVRAAAQRQHSEREWAVSASSCECAGATPARDEHLRRHGPIFIAN